MYFQGAVYRPPIEANTFLLQVASGCTHNKCTFCNMFAGEQFQRIPMSILEKNLQEAQIYHRNLKRIFLVGGDAFVLSASRLTEIMARIRFYFPECETVSMYSAVRNVLTKTDEQLLTLQQIGINDLYVGLETGDDSVLTQINKGHTLAEAREQMLRLNDAGIRHHSLLMTGVAGQGRGIANAMATVDLLNEIKPTIIISTTLAVFPNTALAKQVESGEFVEASELENLQEEKALIQNLDLPTTYFWGNHPLNSTPIAGVLGEDQDTMIQTLEHSIASMDETEFKKRFKRTTL